MYQVLWEGSQYFNNSWQLIVLWVSRKYRDSEKELRAYTTKGPHIDSSIVWEPQEDFGAAIVPWLNVLKDSETLKASAAEIYDFQIRVLFPIIKKIKN